MTSGTAPRLAAVRLLGRVLDQAGTLQPDDASSAGTRERDQAMALHLAYGVLRWRPALEWLAGELMRKPLKKRDRDIERLIWIGLFQLWKDGTPPHAAVHETAGAARQLGKTWAVGLVNAVLRNFTREQQRLSERLATRPERFAHPEWLMRAIREDWPNSWQDILQANNRRAPLFLRVNVRRGSVSQASRKLTDAGFEVGIHPEAAEALRIEPAVAVVDLPGFAEGLVSVQDPAAQLAATLVDAQPGQRVLDACAAPGGKTCHLLERHPDIELIALDRDGDRLARVSESLQRLRLESDSCRLMQADAGEPETWWDGRPFDRILLDAPCTATGVIRRHPEIKNLRSEDQLCQAVADQRRLLDALWPLLGPGGMLVYATCSVLRDENDRQIARFLERQPDAANAGGGRQIFPGQEEMDGFYYARLLKTR